MLIALNLLGVVVGSPIFHHLEPRQSSDGCGPNPLVAVMFYAREFGKNQLIKRIAFLSYLIRLCGQPISVLSNCSV